MAEHFRFVCKHCNAQWFARVEAMRCPRCNRRSFSDEQIDPPWLNFSKRPSPDAPAEKDHTTADQD